MSIVISYLMNGRIETTDKTNGYIKIQEVTNGLRTVVKITALEDLIIKEAYMDRNFTFNKTDSIFCNGYQSWTDSKEYSIDEKMNNLKQVPSMVQKMYSFASYGDVAWYEYKKGVLHAHDIAYVKGCENIFIGNNNFCNSGLIIEFHTAKNFIRLLSDVVDMRVKQNNCITLFDYEIAKFTDLSTVSYFNKFTPRKAEKLFGYSSWYNHFDKVNEQIILDNINALDSTFDLFQLDDGYESKVGDWMEVDKTKFPNGLEGIVKKIHEKGVKAGIWIAPFVAQEGSKLIEEHPSWLKLEDGKPIKCGCNWGGFYALDFTKNEVKDYIKQCLTYYADMGFDFFKLDFLYAIALPAYGGRNRSEITRSAYQFLRDCLPDKIILANGALMAPSFGLFEYVRIGCDVSMEWDDVFYMRMMHRERNSTKKTIQNTIFRSIFNNKVFMNDPDVFLLRDDNNKLTSNQRLSLAIINALFGSMLMTSDDISKYTDRERENLNIIMNLFKNASNAKFKANGNNIDISYDLNGRTYTYVYDTENGELKISLKSAAFTF